MSSRRRSSATAPEDAHETTYLNKKLKWNEANWMSYEGDEKHADVCFATGDLSTVEP